MKEKLNKVIVMDVGHVKKEKELNPDEKFILEKYSLHNDSLFSNEVSFDFASKYIDAIMKQAEIDTVGLIYLIVGYGSTGYGGTIKKALLKLLEKGKYNKIIRRWLTVSNHNTYVDTLNNDNTKHGIIKLYTRFSYEDNQKLCYFMTNDEAELAFVNLNKPYVYLQKFILPEMVKFEDKYCKLVKINKNVFFGMHLSSICIPKSVIEIDDYAFFQCRVEKSFEFESESMIMRIGDSAFAGSRLPGNFIIQNSVTEIASHAFSGLQVEKEIILEHESKLEKIGDWAFEKCINLYDITIPKTVIEIGHNAFSGTSLKNVAFEKGINISIIKESVFSNCRKLTKITIPNSVTEIKRTAFSQCNKLKSINFQDESHLVKIGDYAFLMNSSLINLTIPKCVKEIGEYAFIDCQSLIDITFENDSLLTIIRKGAFENCQSLNKVVFPKSIKMIYDHAFKKCSKLNLVEFQEGSKLTLCNRHSVFLHCNSLKLPEIPFENQNESC